MIRGKKQPGICHWSGLRQINNKVRLTTSLEDYLDKVEKRLEGSNYELKQKNK